MEDQKMKAIAEIVKIIEQCRYDDELSENASEIVMAAELIENYLLDKRFMRELEDWDEYDAA